MSFWIELVLFVVAVVVLVVGYHRNRRNWLVVGAILLFASTHIVEFSAGFIDGFNDGYVD